MKIVGKLLLTLGVQSLAVLAPPVIAPVGLADPSLGTKAWLGVYIALLYLAAMLATLISGDLIARFGPLRVSQLSLLLCGGSIALTSLGHSVYLFLAPLLIGFGYGPITPTGRRFS